MSTVRRNGLVDALDALVGVGVTLSGDAIIQLAGVDLIRLDLRLLLAAVEDDVSSPRGDRAATRWDPAGPRRVPAAGGGGKLPAHDARKQAPHESDHADALSADQGLGRVVLAVIELVRQLLERQAIRRMRCDSLDDCQLERLGDALQQLESRSAELREALGVSRPDVERTLGSIEQVVATPQRSNR